MKKKYNDLSVEVVTIDTADIMTTSLTKSYDPNGSDDGTDISKLFKF